MIITNRYGAVASAGAGGAFPLAYYLGVYDNTSYTRNQQHINSPDGGTVIFGRDYATSPHRGYIVWTDSFGAFVDAKHLYNPSDQTEITSAVYDDAGNLYVAGYRTSRMFLVKFDTNRNIVWQRQLFGNSSYNSIVPYDIGIAPDGYIYIAGKGNYAFTSGGGGMFVAKYSTAGVHQWHYMGGNTYNGFYGISFDASSNLYLNGYNYNSDFATWHKWTNGGAIYWQKRINQTGVRPYLGSAYDATTDSLFLSGEEGTSGSSLGIYKIQGSTGLVVTATRLVSNYILYGGNCKIGSDGFLYVSAKATYSSDPYAGSNYQLHWSKWNTSLALQLQREVNYNPSGANPFNGVQNYRIQLDADDNVYMSSYGEWNSKSTNDCAMFYKAPPDGSKTGNYTLWSKTVNYRAGSATTATASYTATSNTSITFPYTLTATTDSMTTASITGYTFYSVEMP